jgi:hypothetical protein
MRRRVTFATTRAFFYAHPGLTALLKNAARTLTLFSK